MEKSSTELFIDGVINVSLVKSLVRIDLYSLSATETQPDGTPKPEFRQRLIMHPTALPDIHRSIQFAVAALRERGLIPVQAGEVDNQSVAAPAMVDPVADFTRGPDGAPTVSDASGQAAAPDIKKPRSPNFPATMDQTAVRNTP